MTKEEILKYEPPAAKLLGREVLELDEVNGTAVIRYTAQPEFLNRHGTVQGGLLAAMLDSATALALYTVLPPELTALTTNLNVSYLRPAKLGAFTASAKLTQRSDREAQTVGELADADGTIVARAVATLRIVQRRST